MKCFLLKSFSALWHGVLKKSDYNTDFQPAPDLIDVGPVPQTYLTAYNNFNKLKL